MMKAAIPMTGGVIWPPVEAQASIAAARWGRNPARFISGIVTVPTVMTFETMLPEIDPNKDEPTMAILAGPRSEEHTSELQSLAYLVCRLLLEKKKKSRGCERASARACRHRAPER